MFIRYEWARFDALAEGKPCGKGYISKDKKCGVGAGMPSQGGDKQARAAVAKKRLMQRLADETAKRFEDGTDREYIKIPIKPGSDENIIEVYTRKSTLQIGGKKTPVTKVANIQFHERARGQGLGEAYLNAMADKFPDRAVYVESVQPRWKAHLLKNGFIEDPDDPGSVYKPAKKQRTDSMLDVIGYEYIRFDTLGDLPLEDDGFIRFDKNCTPGKTIPCGNACRAPQNCKSRNRVSESNQGLRQNYADQIRKQRGLKSRAEVAEGREFDRAMGKGRSKSKTLGMGPKAAAKARSEAAKRGVETRNANQSTGGRLAELRSKYQTKSGNLNARAKKALSRGTSEQEREAMLDELIKARETKGKSSSEYKELYRKTGAADLRDDLASSISSSKKARTAKGATKTERSTESQLAKMRRQTRSTPEKDRMLSTSQKVRKARAKRRKDGTWEYIYD